jgi:hypothetical protein
MLSNVWIALLFSFGSAGWIFAKTQKSTAGQKTSFIIASVAFAAIFIVMTVILDALFKK